MAGLSVRFFIYIQRVNVEMASLGPFNSMARDSVLQCARAGQTG